MNFTNKLRITVICALILFIVWASFSYPQQILANLDKLKALVEQHLVASTLLFIGIYVAATILVFLPISFLTLIGGWLFGPILGSCCNVIGALIGASLAFLVSRHFASDWVAQHIGPRLKTVHEGVSRAGWRFVALVRLTPILPFNVLNCALGLTGIRFKEYIIATAIFMLPAKIAYTYVGSLGFAFIVNPHQSELIKIVIGCGAIIAALGIPWIIKYFRRSTLHHE